MKIGVDMDSTLCHTWSAIEKIARDHFGCALDYHRHAAEPYRYLDMESFETCVEMSHEPHYVRCLPAYPGGATILQRWVTYGHDVEVVTHRPEGSRNATHAWLKKHGFPDIPVVCTEDKVPYCVARGVSLLIDDTLPTLRRARAAGLTVAALRQPWNRSCGRWPGMILESDWSALASRLTSVVSDTRGFRERR